MALLVPSNFDASLQAITIFREESQAAVLGRKTPEQAAAAMQSRIEPLVKK
jgi:ABC-type glycerol-3-phosphate transport system substrate-binding protein